MPYHGTRLLSPWGRWLLGLPGSASPSSNLSKFNLADLKLCFKSICSYLDIYDERINEDTTLSLGEYFRLIFTLKLYNLQDAPDIKALSKASALQTAAIVALQIKVEQL